MVAVDVPCTYKTFYLFCEDGDAWTLVRIMYDVPPCDPQRHGGMYSSCTLLRDLFQILEST